MSEPLPAVEVPAPPAPDVVVLVVGAPAPGDLAGLEGFVAETGARLVTASAGPEAAEVLLRHEVALVIVDAQLPGLGGVELAEPLREMLRTRRVPILFLTAAVPEPGRIVREYEVGAADVLVMPVDRDLLRGKVAVLIELSRQRRLLAAQMEALRSLDRTFDLLIGVLGHDLRNPLNAISLAGETLLLARPGDEVAALIAERIRSASQRMGRMISQIVDFAALRSGSVPIQARDADLRQLCDTAAGEFEQLTKRDFTCAVDGDPRGSWDPHRILQLFSNLIGHALEQGNAAARIAVRIDGRNPDALFVEVEHDGALPERAKENLFTPFSSPGETRGGARLGLYIADQIARAHGGSVHVEPRGDRTVLKARLPRHYVAASDV